jgi:hypothetical protein
MQLERYVIIADQHHMTYEFFSNGPNGLIKKGVEYREMKKNFFNLGFGDWNEQEQRLDDNVRSNNNDRDKVLSTVAITIIDFMRYHPKAVIIAKGSTPSRTRLYQISIQANWHQVTKEFIIEGFRNAQWEAFEKGRNYEAFSLQAK